MITSPPEIGSWINIDPKKWLKNDIIDLAVWSKALGEKSVELSISKSCKDYDIVSTQHLLSFSNPLTGESFQTNSFLVYENCTIHPMRDGKPCEEIAFTLSKPNDPLFLTMWEIVW